MRVKIFSILLLTGLVTSSFTTHVIFQIRKILAFHQFTERNNPWPAEQIKVFNYNGQQDFQWEKKNKEFYFQGKIFDVISTMKTSTGLLIKCVADSKEDDMIATYLKLTNHSEEAHGLLFLLNLKITHAVVIDDPQSDLEIMYTNDGIVLSLLFPSAPDVKTYSPPPEQSPFYTVG